MQQLQILAGKVKNLSVLCFVIWGTYLFDDILQLKNCLFSLGRDGMMSGRICPICWSIFNHLAGIFESFSSYLRKSDNAFCSKISLSNPFTVGRSFHFQIFQTSNLKKKSCLQSKIDTPSQTLEKFWVENSGRSKNVLFGIIFTKNDLPLFLPLKREEEN